MEENKYYVYQWINRQTNTPFYVGKGCGDRYKRKGRSHRNHYFVNYTNKYDCYSQILYNNLTEQEAFQKQIQTIKQYRDKGYQLCNLSDGGEGSPHPQITQAYRQKYHQMFLGQNNPNYGNKWTDQQKKHLSDLKKERGLAKGKNNPRAKSVMCVQTGKIYDYQRQAAKDIGLKDTGSIHHALKDKRFKAKGYHFVSGEMIQQLNTEQLRQQYLNNI